MKPPTPSARTMSAPMSVLLVISISKRRPPSGAGRLRHGFWEIRREILARIHKTISLDLILLVVQLPISAIRGEQIVVAPLLHDLPALEHENPVGAPDCRQAMRDDERR